MNTYKLIQFLWLALSVVFTGALATESSPSDRPLRQASVSAQERRRDKQDRPNIIFIFADDWGYGDLSSHGSSFVKTPHIDRMAAEGIDFQNFTVNSPVCSPSRVAVMSGKFPASFCIHQHFAGVPSNKKRGMPDWLDPEAPILPRILKEAGYKTGHFGMSAPAS